MQLELITPAGVSYEGDAYEIELPTPAGPVTILPEHMPLVTSLATGVLSVRTRPGAGYDHYAIGGGILRTEHNKVVVASEMAEHASTIDALKARQEMEKAESELVAQQEADDITLTQGVIERNAARLSASQRQQG
jgi:F-type H+-transporting ATPase subunit epsilon